ncbi:AraC family transcriptional regulator [Quadrisphaera oryzae]|uniref:AraC family transcriptional regulator n=1 Tax=Quadrisphaera TaxID=317661 RepID=UPI0016492D3B|nr:AraC family transcriptional regulator [Quadrisphaera sp. RL12-1S]
MPLPEPPADDGAERASREAPHETLLFAWLRADDDATRPQDTSDAIVVRSSGPAPRISRRLELDTVECAVVEGDEVDVEPFPTARAWRGVLLGYLESGELSIDQEGRRVDLQRGDFVFYTAAQRYRIRSAAAHRFLVVRIPTSALVLRHGLFTDVLATDLNDLPSAPLLRSLLTVLADPGYLPSLPARAHAADALVAAAHAVIADAREPGTAEAMSQFHRIVVWIDGHLADDDLTTERVAAGSFVSSRTVRRVFSLNGTTVSALVRQRRLERIRNTLLDPREQGTAIGAIAARWGFREPSAFSRAFTQQFGMPPRRYRALHLHQGGAAPVPAPEPTRSPR